MEIDVPPLRDRPDDVMPLADRMLVYFRGGRVIRGFTDAAAAALRRYPWPGNVRELRNAVERATVVSDGPMIGVEHLAKSLLPDDADADALPPARLGEPVTFERIEAEHLRLLLARTGSLDQVAKALRIDTTTLWRKRRRYGL